MQFAEQIYKQICGFGEYGFPESHSASFALLAYASAYCKHYYPLQFLAGLLNSLPMGFYSPAQLIADAKRHQLSILPVCINHSDWDHQLEQTGDTQALRLGFRLVKGLNKTRMTAVLARRPATGFQSLAELTALLQHQADLQALASADALTLLSGHRFASRWQLMDSHTSLPLFQSTRQEAATTQSQPDVATTSKAPAQLGLAFTDNHCPLPAPSNWQQLQEDQLSMGLSLTQHPLALLRPQLAKYRLTPAVQLAALPDNALVRVAGQVTVRQSPGTAGGVTFVTLEDETGPINLIVWQATALAQQQAFLSSRLMLVHGTLQQAAGVIHVIAGRIECLDALLPGFTCAGRDFY